MEKLIKKIEVNELGISHIEIRAYYHGSMMDNFYDKETKAWSTSSENERYDSMLVRALSKYPNITAARNAVRSGELHIGIMYIEVHSAEDKLASAEVPYNYEVTADNFLEFIEPVKEDKVSAIFYMYLAPKLAKLVMDKIYNKN